MEPRHNAILSIGLGKGYDRSRRYQRIFVHLLKWAKVLDVAGEDRLYPFTPDLEALEADAGRYIGLVRVKARREGA